MSERNKMRSFRRNGVADAYNIQQVLEIFGESVSLNDIQSKLFPLASNLLIIANRCIEVPWLPRRQNDFRELQRFLSEDEIELVS